MLTKDEIRKELKVAKERDTAMADTYCDGVEAALEWVLQDEPYATPITSYEEAIEGIRDSESHD